MWVSVWIELSYVVHIFMCFCFRGHSPLQFWLWLYESGGNFTFQRWFSGSVIRYSYNFTADEGRAGFQWTLQIKSREPVEQSESETDRQTERQLKVSWVPTAYAYESTDQTLSHTHRDTHTETQTDTHTHTERERDTHTQRHRHTHTHTHTHTPRETQTHTDTHTHTHTERDTHTERERQTHTHTHTHTERDTDTDTHTHTHTHCRRPAVSLFTSPDQLSLQMTKRGITSLLKMPHHNDLHLFSFPVSNVYWDFNSI